MILDLCDSYVELHAEDFLRLHPRILFLACDHPTHGILLPPGYRAVLEKPLHPDKLDSMLAELLAENWQTHQA